MKAVKTTAAEFPIYMDPDRVGTFEETQGGGLQPSRFQFIWIPTESGQVLSCPATPLGSGFQFIWIPTESGQGHRCNSFKLSKVFPIYMDPDRVGTLQVKHALRPYRPVSNLYGSRQSRVESVFAESMIRSMFPIYMDPDRVGLMGKAPFAVTAVVSNLYGSRQSREAT